MGTRHLIIVKSGDVTHSQYSQWDGYPESAGMATVDFIRSEMEEATLAKHLHAAKFLSTEDCAALGENWKATHPQLSRDTGTDIFEYIQKTPKPELHSDLDFAADSLMCEWAWMLDLDARELLCFKGFNIKPLEDGQPFKHLTPKRNGEYHPIRLVQRLPFEKVKTMTGGDFFALFDPGDDE